MIKQIYDQPFSTVRKDLYTHTTNGEIHITEDDRSRWDNAANAKQQVVDLSLFPTVETIDNKISQFEKSRNYISSIPALYATDEEVESKTKVLTKLVQDVDDKLQAYYNKDEVVKLIENRAPNNAIVDALYDNITGILTLRRGDSNDIRIRIRGTQGRSSSTLQVYTVSDTQPARPVGGLFSFDMLQLTLPKGVDGAMWSRARALDGTIWMSEAVFYSDLPDSEVEWSEPMLISGQTTTEINHMSESHVEVVYHVGYRKIKGDSETGRYYVSVSPEAPVGGKYDAVSNSLLEYPHSPTDSNDLWLSEPDFSKTFTNDLLQSENDGEDYEMLETWYFSIGAMGEGTKKIKWSTPAVFGVDYTLVASTMKFVAINYSVLAKHINFSANDLLISIDNAVSVWMDKAGYTQETFVDDVVQKIVNDQNGISLISGKVGDNYDKFTESWSLLNASIEGLKTEVSSANGYYSSVNQTAEQIQAYVKSVDGKASEIKQTSDEISAKLTDTDGNPIFWTKADGESYLSEFLRSLQDTITAQSGISEDDFYTQLARVVGEDVNTVKKEDYKLFGSTSNTGDRIIESFGIKDANGNKIKTVSSFVNGIWGQENVVGSVDGKTLSIQKLLPEQISSSVTTYFESVDGKTMVDNYVAQTLGSDNITLFVSNMNGSSEIIQKADSIKQTLLNEDGGVSAQFVQSVTDDVSTTLIKSDRFILNVGDFVSTAQQNTFTGEVNAKSFAYGTVDNNGNNFVKRIEFTLNKPAGRDVPYSSSYSDSTPIILINDENGDTKYVVSMEDVNNGEGGREFAYYDTLDDKNHIYTPYQKLVLHKNPEDGKYYILHENGEYLYAYDGYVYTITNNGDVPFYNSSITKYSSIEYLEAHTNYRINRFRITDGAIAENSDKSFCLYDAYNTPAEYQQTTFDLIYPNDYVYSLGGYSYANIVSDIYFQYILRNIEDIDIVLFSKYGAPTSSEFITDKLEELRYFYLDYCSKWEFSETRIFFDSPYYEFGHFETTQSANGLKWYIDPDSRMTFDIKDNVWDCKITLKKTSEQYTSVGYMKKIKIDIANGIFNKLSVGAVGYGYENGVKSKFTVKWYDDNYVIVNIVNSVIVTHYDVVQSLIDLSLSPDIADNIKRAMHKYIVTKAACELLDSDDPNLLYIFDLNTSSLAESVISVANTFGGKVASATILADLLKRTLVQNALSDIGYCTFATRNDAKRNEYNDFFMSKDGKYPGYANWYYFSENGNLVKSGAYDTDAAKMEDVYIERAADIYEKYPTNNFGWNIYWPHDQFVELMDKADGIKVFDLISRWYNYAYILITNNPENNEHNNGYHISHLYPPMNIKLNYVKLIKQWFNEASYYFVINEPLDPVDNVEYCTVYIPQSYIDIGVLEIRIYYDDVDDQVYSRYASLKCTLIFTNKSKKDKQSYISLQDLYDQARKKGTTETLYGERFMIGDRSDIFYKATYALVVNNLYLLANKDVLKDSTGNYRIKKRDLNPPQYLENTILKFGNASTTASTISLLNSTFSNGSNDDTSWIVGNVLIKPTEGWSYAYDGSVSNFTGRSKPIPYVRKIKIINNYISSKYLEEIDKINANSSVSKIKLLGPFVKDLYNENMYDYINFDFNDY